MEVAQAAVDRFLDKEFVWGKRDCAHLAAFVLVEFGHPDPLSEIKHYDTLLSAKKAFRKAGLKSLEEPLDRMGFARIAPASALPGDIVAIPSDDPEWCALGVNIGDGRVMAFGNGRGIWWPDSSVVETAWRVTCLR